MPLTESGFLPSIDYTARDFDAIRGALVKHLQNYFPNDWQDFAESNLGTAILELVAYVGDQLSFYLDRVANEMFLPTVTQRQNAINLVNLIGYVPRTTAAASVAVQATLEAQATATVVNAPLVVQDRNGNPWEFLTNVEIPAGRSDTKDIVVGDEILGVADGSSTYSFITDNDNLTLGSAVLVFTVGMSQFTVEIGTDGNIVLPFGGAGFLDHSTGDINLSFLPSQVPVADTDITISYEYSQKITLFQGRTRNDRFSSTGLPNQEFTLTATPVLLSPLVLDEDIVPDPNRFEVWIGDPGAPYGNETGTRWRRVDSLVIAGPDEEVYELRIDESDHVIVVFGDNITGVIPEIGTTNITVIYRTGGGRIGNINLGDLSTTVTGSTGFFGVPVQILNYERGSGGAERESLDEIRVNAPAFLRTNNTATTEQDYDSLSLFSSAGQGAIVRAKSRLTPSEPIVTKTVHTAEVLGVVPSPSVLEYYLRMPASPIVIETVSLQYETAAGVQFASAVDLGSGLAQLVNDGGSSGLDSVNTRMRYDEQDISDAVPVGFTGDGATFDFNGLLVKKPIFPGSIVFRYTIDGTDYVGIDDGEGNLVGTKLNSDLSSIIYSSGVINMVFATRATLTSGQAEPYDLDSLNGGGAVDLVIEVDGGGDTTITFTSGDFADYTAALAQEVADVINVSLPGLASVDDSGRIVLQTTTNGTAGSVQVKAASGNPDANAEFGFSLSEVTGTEDPPDSASVISFDYQSALHLVLTTLPVVGTDILISMESGPTLKEFPTNNIEVYVWSEGPDGELTTPSSALKDSLKTFLDERRVLGTSIEILNGFIVKVNYFLEVTFDAAISQTDTQERIVSSIEALFADPVQTRAGEDVPIAAVVDAIYPLQGVVKPTPEEVSIRVPIGTGDGNASVFKTQDGEPGEHLDEGKLPGIAGLGKVTLYLDNDKIGQNSNGSNPTLITTATGSLTSVLGNSTFDLETGEFDIRLSPAPQIGQVLSIQYSLDQTVGGIKLWNIAINQWEIGVLGEIWINGIKVRG